MANQFKAFYPADLATAVETPHYTYSEVFLREHEPSHLAVISSGKPIAFADMVNYFTQADPFEQFLVDQQLERTGAPLTWYYLNQPEQPADPDGNPVRAPFTFEVGYEINEPPAAVGIPSETVGRYETHPLRALRVASVFYRGSFPHQEHSGFAEAWMTLVTKREALDYQLSFALYREIYHHLDYDDPSASVSEIQVELA